MKILREPGEGRLVATARVDLEQLDAHPDPVRLQAQRFLQDFLGLLFATVRDVHVGLGHRIDLVRIELRGGRNEA